MESQMSRISHYFLDCNLGDSFNQQFNLGLAVQEYFAPAQQELGDWLEVAGLHGDVLRSSLENFLFEFAGCKEFEE